jgi:AraC-like DNA-binding protein
MSPIASPAAAVPWRNDRRETVFAASPSPSEILIARNPPVAFLRRCTGLPDHRLVRRRPRIWRHRATSRGIGALPEKAWRLAKAHTNRQGSNKTRFDFLLALVDDSAVFDRGALVTRVPAPLLTAVPPPDPTRVVELPALRWASVCEAAQFEVYGQVPSHAHNEPELVLCTKGTIWIDVAGLALEGRPGDLYVLPARKPHALRSEGAWENICVLYAGGDSLLDTGPRTIDVTAEPQLPDWFRDLCALHDSHPKAPGPVADSLLLTILLRTAEIERHSRSMGNLHPRLAAAIDFMHQRPGSNLTASELAEATCTSYSHLSALFRGEFGYGPLEYHRRQRMQRAQTLLLDPFVSIGEVAENLGFDDINYFVRVFRKTWGVSPNRWRKRAS